MTLISLHLPKTAGTSFRASLKAHFGESYRDDYSDGGISLPAKERFTSAISAGLIIAKEGLGNVDCVHGHFLPAKYWQLAKRCDLTFVTWMREPVARLFSHYYYWQESYDKSTANAHHRQVIEEKWTLEQFCLSERFRNIYMQYLSGFSMEKFAFIGVSEHYQEDMLDFSDRFLSAHLTPEHLNPTRYLTPRRNLSDVFLDKVREFHADDVQLYRRALEWRQLRHRGEGLHHPTHVTAPKALNET